MGASHSMLAAFIPSYCDSIAPRCEGKKTNVTLSFLDKQYCEAKLRDAMWTEHGTEGLDLFVTCTIVVATPATLRCTQHTGRARTTQRLHSP